MSRVQNPLFSTDASGNLGQNGNGVCFFKKGGRNYVKLAIGDLGKRAPGTASQLVIQGYFTDAVNAWHAETSTVRTNWDNYAKATFPYESGYNLYVGTFCKFLVDHTGTPPTVTTTAPTMS